MSKQTIADITCTNCGQTFEVEVYTSVNSKLNPELRHSILAGTFFNHFCSFCGYKNNPFYEVLYHDMDKNFMVWLVKPDEDNIIFMQQHSLKAGALFSDYKLFIARYPFQWIERIVTSELGMDARLIELYKFGIKEKEQFPLKTQNDFLHFQKYTRNLIGRTKFHWKYVYDNGETEDYSKSLNANKYQEYERLIQTLEPSLKPSTWYLIDWQFPFGKEIDDGELIQLPDTSNIIEIGTNQKKLPSQFIEVVERTGKGHTI